MQQQANYDLLAVFNDESKADAAEAKLRKEGFGDEEVFRLPASAAAGGQFREHGPNRERSSVFLQTTRSRPNPTLVIVLAVVLGLVFGIVMFLAHFAFAVLPEPSTAFEGGVVGVVVGAIIGLLQRGRVRGAIGQNTPAMVTPNRRPEQNVRTVVAVRLPDPENISRKSKARAILLNNGGKIDRSVGT